jgi:hypothetical protein
MNSNTSVLGSLDERLQQVAKILGKSVEQVEQELSSILGPKSEDWQDLMESLGKEDEEYVKFGDFMKAFHDDSKDPSPIALVRKAVATFKVKTESKQEQLSPRMSELKSLFGVKPTLESVDSADLFRAYLTDNPNDPVTTELKRRYGDKAVMAYLPGTKDVAVNETIDYITDIAQGLPEQIAIYVDGELARLYPVGKTPTEMIEEDPLFQGIPLIRGRSTVNNINWTGVDMETRQLIRIAVARGEFNTLDRLNMIELAKKARENGFKVIKEMFPESALEFNERKADATLPGMKVRLNGQKSNNPFLGKNRSF